MDNSHLLRAPGLASAGKMKQIQEAKTMAKAVRERAERLNTDPPPYTLLELIGKGSFGRVFKSSEHGRRSLVAVKIIDVDSSDYQVDLKNKDEAIKDFTREISILQQLKQARAKNINVIYDAFSFHSQLWIVSEYCPGGSVHTLMKASPRPGLEERYIIPIARELAVAMKFVHEAKIIHRDIKAANILITQDGQLQLCDFGVSGILQNNVDKRTTIIGTPQWMAPELHGVHGFESAGYGTEIDCWAFGCTMYELATGQPPNARIMPEKLALFLQTAPKLLGNEYSQALREFVAFCLEVRPEHRPTADTIIKHPFIFNTQKRFPTVTLKELITRYAQWEQQGGQRASLFNPFGAAAPTMLGPSVPNEEDEWNFSTMDEGDQAYPGQFDSPPRARHAPADSSNESTPRQNYGSLRGRTPFEQARQDVRADRGGMKMEAIFNENMAPYEYSTEVPEEPPMSDLPLRNLSISDAPRESVIDLDGLMNMDIPSLDLPNQATVKPVQKNRFYAEDEAEGYSTPVQEHPPRHVLPVPSLAPQTFAPPKPRDLSVPMARSMTDGMRPKTQEWSFSMAQAEFRAGPGSAVETEFLAPVAQPLAAPFRPTLKHTVTEPLGIAGDFMHPSSKSIDSSFGPADRVSIIDLDQLYSEDHRPSTAASSAAGSVMTDNNDNPFYLEDGETAKRNPLTQQKPGIRSSFHLHSQSEPVVPEHASNSARSSAHIRAQNSYSSESDWERTNRISSVPASIDFLRQNIAADSGEEYLEMRQTSPVRSVRRAPQAMGTIEQQYANGTWPDMMHSFQDDSTASDTDYSRKHSIASTTTGSKWSSPGSHSRGASHSRDRTADTEQSYHHRANSFRFGQGPRDRSGTASTTASRAPPYNIGSLPTFPNGMGGSFPPPVMPSSALHNATGSFQGHASNASSSFLNGPHGSSVSSTDSVQQSAIYPVAIAATNSIPVTAGAAIGAALMQQQTTPVPAHRRHQRDRAGTATNSSITSVSTSFSTTGDRILTPVSNYANDNSIGSSATITPTIVPNMTHPPPMIARPNDTITPTNFKDPPNGSNARKVMSFPEPSPPDPVALEEDANLDIVVAESERLLEDFLVGLRAAKGLLGSWSRDVGVGA